MSEKNKPTRSRYATQRYTPSMNWKQATTKEEDTKLTHTSDTVKKNSFADYKDPPAIIKGNKKRLIHVVEPVKKSKKTSQSQSGFSQQNIDESSTEIETDDYAESKLNYSTLLTYEARKCIESVQEKIKDMSAEQAAIEFDHLQTHHHDGQAPTDTSFYMHILENYMYFSAMQTSLMSLKEEQLRKDPLWCNIMSEKIVWMDQHVPPYENATHLHRYLIRFVATFDNFPDWNERLFCSQEFQIREFQEVEQSWIKLRDIYTPSSIM